MEILSSKEKGDMFEDEVFEFFKGHILSGDYYLNPDKCKFFQQKGYYSHDRKSNIKVDISIEVHAKNKDNLSLLLVVECKNLSHRVGVEDIEEFNSKLLQISGRNVKGIIFTKVGYRSGAFEYASSMGIALARLLPEEQIDWVLERTPKAVNIKDKKTAEKNEILNALTISDYRGQSEAIFSVYKECFTSTFSEIIEALIPQENKETTTGKNDKSSSYSRYIPYLGQEDIEQRVYKILNYFKSNISSNHQIILHPICEYLTNNNKIEFIFDENLGVNSKGSEILGKLTFYPHKIFVSSSLEENSPRWRFTLAHEVGHFLLHRKSFKELFTSGYYETDDSLTWDGLNNSKNLRLEWQANSFASSLLLPRDSFISIVINSVKKLGINKFSNGIIYLDDQKDNIYTYQQILFLLKQEFNVSLQAINYRLIQLKLLNNQQKQKHITDLVRNIQILR